MSQFVMTAKEILDAAERLAQQTGSEATPWDARLLLAHSMGGRNPLSLDARQELDAPVEALGLARANAGRHDVLRRLSLLASDWLRALGSTRFDLALSNPPYL